LQELRERAERVSAREADLTARFARFHEFLEYPLNDPNASRSPAVLQQLTEQDRQVQRLLESEAERVYEKIRANGYTRDGLVDLEMIRGEVESLITRVARVYSPNSKNPLLETSFEQLARAASRICLHTLVLLEQLPLSVQKQSVSDLYGYLQKATTAWGTYKAAAPWLKQASRGLYAGRILATSNPVALGAWWLAMEVGRRGATHLVESWVDRQAVAVLNDLIAVIGVEIASIYGEGFRQRDAAWVHGCEIVELLHCFPASREGLQEGLNLITQLPLRNEYDRIYLYRCLATRRSTGHRIADSSLLSREDRETIASSVENFFHQHVHGTTEKDTQKWRSGLEERLDLKLNLHPGTQNSRTALEQVTDSMRTLRAFAQSVIGASPDVCDRCVANTRLGRQAAELQVELSEQVPADSDAELIFQPPDLDPSSVLVTDLLHDMARLTAVLAPAEDHIVDVVVQTGGWFRKPAAAVAEILDAEWLAELQLHAETSAVHPAITGEVARWILMTREQPERLVFSFPHIGRTRGDQVLPLEGSWLIGLYAGARAGRRTFVMNASGVVWQHTGKLTVVRRSSILLDSAELVGGMWQQTDFGGNIVVSGSLRGGRYSSYFRPLLLAAGDGTDVISVE
jgi:hypothetical protein